MSGSTLQLKYYFTPNPIHASGNSQNPNTIDLQVTVYNPSSDPIVIKSITIVIPVGQEGADTLSTSPDLPSPVFDTTTGWQAYSSGSNVTLTLPTTGILDSFVFTLPDIQVDLTPGVVPITITEINPPAPKVTDSTCYSLLKQQAGLPIVLKFSATPQALDNRDVPVTLTWECSKPEVPHMSYSVHSDSLYSDNSPWYPKDCLGAGDCFTCADGLSGVVTPPLQHTTIFELDVIKTNPDGNRSIIEMHETTVKISVPYFSGTPFVEEKMGGWVVELHWLALNAGHCEVELDGKLIDSNAPTNTIEQGYAVVMGATGLHQLSVNACGRAGTLPASFYFPAITISNPGSINAGNNVMAIAVMPDSKLALVANWDNVTVIDIANRTPEANTIPVGGSLSTAIAITPDNKLALVLVAGASGIGSVTVIDIANRAAEANMIPVGSFPTAIAVTPLDGKLALVVNAGLNDSNFGTVTVIDIANRTAEANTIPVGSGPNAIAITPDSKLALVANAHDDNNVMVIDIAERQVTNTIPVGNGPSGIAITPDSKLALVLVAGASGIGSVTVIDIAERQVTNTIPVGNGPEGIAITPDGSLALVTNNNDNNVAVIDIASLTIKTRIPVGNGPSDIAITPDGSVALVTNGDLKTVTVI